MVTQKVAELADAAGLLYPPDPGSMKISTIRGNVAEHSGGLRGLKYGVTRDYVMGLEVVLANGRGSRDRLGHYRRQDHPVHAGVFGPDHDEIRRGICPRGLRKSVARYANDVGNFVLVSRRLGGAKS